MTIWGPPDQYGNRLGQSGRTCDPTGEAMTRLRLARERLDAATQEIQHLVENMRRAMRELATILEEARR